MGAPTWPPTPDDAVKATLAEYGDQAHAFLNLEDDEEAERQLLARLLFQPPGRELASGEAIGSPLEPFRRSLEAWLCMISGRVISIAPSDPASTDGERLFLPRAMPAPLQPGEDAVLFRAMALVQLGLLDFGFLKHRRFLVEIHRDWVLRSCYHLLAVRYIVRRWPEIWPGMRRDFDALRFVDKAAIMRVNLLAVPLKGMPDAFLALYDGLLSHIPESRQIPPVVTEAIAAVDEIEAQAGAPLVVMGQAQRLRQFLREARLGPPPLPWFCGIIRPEWLLHDIAAESRESEAWRDGPKPLALLKRAVERKGRRGGMNDRIRKIMGADTERGLPETWQEATREGVARPSAQDDSRLYDEWDGERGIVKVGICRVREEEAPGGSLDAWNQLVAANRDLIREVERRFESLRLEERWLHGQPDGTELDMDRAIRGLIDIRSGHTPKELWYKRYQRQREAVAILTLVDVSGSTAGNIIRLEQEALVLLAAGLQSLRFPHAFHAFSNQGPQDCRLQRIKDWNEPLDEASQRRLSNLRPGGATRLGAFLRHAGWMLSRRPEARRILLVVSDGRPHCEGQYRDRYGVLDSAMAIRELQKHGVHPFCVSLDTQGDPEGYLRHIFGAGHFLILDRPDDLPQRLPEVFHSLIS
jgi:nitric oxide reductase NorD protein